MDAEMSGGSQHFLWSKFILGLLEAFRTNSHIQRIHIWILPREGFGNKVPVLLENRIMHVHLSLDLLVHLNIPSIY